MKRVARLYATMIVLLLPHMAAAHGHESPVLGSLIPHNGDMASDKAMSVARETVACTAKRNPSDSRIFVLARDVKVIGAAKARLQSTMSYCLPEGSPENGVMMRFSQDDLQALLAEAMLRQHPVSLAAVAPAPGAYHEDWVGLAPGRAAMNETAICIARTHPDVAAAVIASAPASEAETNAFGALMPLLSECVAPTAGFKATRTGIRLSLAATMYHRMYDGNGVAASEAAGKN